MADVEPSSQGRNARLAQRTFRGATAFEHRTTPPLTKRCRACGLDKPASEFYRQPRSRDGLFSRCKPCQKLYVTAWQRANPERHRAYKQKWADADPEKVAASQARHRRLYRERDRPMTNLLARRHVQVQRAIRSGRLVRPDACQWCGATGVQIETAHQDYAYERRFDVVWLCHRCHVRWDEAEPKLSKKGVRRGAA